MTLRLGSQNVIPLPKPKKFDNGHWSFPEQMGLVEFTGFVYVIKDTILQNHYLGKKSFRKGTGEDSGWRRYVSSSNLLKELFKHRPKEEFQFICLEQYRTRGTLSYSETWTLCLVEAPTSKAWLNTRIEGVTWSVKEMITQRHKDRLKAILESERFQE